MGTTTSGTDILVIGQTEVQKSDVLVVSETGRLPDGFTTVPEIKEVEKQLLQVAMDRPYAGAEHANSIEMLKDQIPDLVTHTENCITYDNNQRKNAITAMVGVGLAALSIAGPLGFDIALGHSVYPIVNKLLETITIGGFVGGVGTLFVAIGKAVHEQLRYNKKSISLARTAMFLNYLSKREAYES